MTGSAQARLASLGELWRLARATSDFRKSYEWRRRHGASEVAIGEAMNAYAYVLFRVPTRRREALELAADASPLLRSGNDASARGLYLRAEHKRARMLREFGRREEALAVAIGAREAARTAQVFDQERQLKALVEKWEREGG